MKQGWEIKKLGEVCETAKNIKWANIPASLNISYIDLSAVDRDSSSITETQLINSSNAPSRAKQIVKYGDVIFATTRPTLRRLCAIPEDYDNAICSTGFCVLRPKKEILTEWIFYTLKCDAYYAYIEPIQKGASYPAVTDNEVKEYTFLMPSLAEQRRIVEILDREFEKIDVLKANAERSLQQAKDLFQSALKQELQCDKYHNLYEVYNIKTGKLNSNAAEEGGIYPFFTCSREIFAINTYAFDCEAILLAGNNASGDFNVKYYNGKFNAYQRTYIITAKKAGINVRILYYILTNYLTTLKKMSLGANTKFLKLGMIENILIPNFDETHMSLVVGRLDDLSKICKKLEENYIKTMALCDDMKQALLRQAFNGEL